MARTACYREFFTVALLLLIVAVSARSAFAHAGLMLPLVLLSYLIWHLSQLARLLRWLAQDNRQRSSVHPPESIGLWAVVFNRLYQRQRLYNTERDHLKSTARTLVEIASAMSDAVVMADKHGRITWCNGVAHKLLGLRFPQDKGQLLVNVVRDPGFVKYYQRARFERALELRSARNSSLYLRIEVTEYGEGNRLLQVRDVTKVNRLERMRVDFVANVSHELRTPLTVLNGYLETLSDVGGSVPEAVLSRVLGQMQSQSNRMEALVNDLTTLSRLESQPEAGTGGQAIDVGRLVRQLVDDAVVHFGAGKQFLLSVDDGSLLLGQEKEIHSAFGNLVNNACKYTGPEGHIEIIWRVVEGRAEFTVCDDGEGIAAQHIPRLTERFYRVDKSRSVNTGGTGLGLAIVKHVLMRHQARLQIDSVAGEGSCFSCLFPLRRVQH